MNGQIKYDNYIESLEGMCGPYSKSDIPDVQMDLRGMVDYAKQVGKNVPELTEKEIEPFLLNMSFDEFQNKKITI